MNNTHLLKTGDNSAKTYFSLQVTFGGSERVCDWDLLIYGGFLTVACHDAWGLCIHIAVRSGSKVWVYVDTLGEARANKKSMFKAWDMQCMEVLEMHLPDVPFSALVL